MSLRTDLLLFAYRTAHYTDETNPRAGTPSHDNLNFQVEELAKSIEALIDQKVGRGDP